MTFFNFQKSKLWNARISHLFNRSWFKIFWSRSLLTLTKCPPRVAHSPSAFGHVILTESKTATQNCLIATHPKSHTPTTSTTGSARYVMRSTVTPDVSAGRDTFTRNLLALDTVSIWRRSSPGLVQNDFAVLPSCSSASSPLQVVFVVCAGVEICPKI